MKRLIDTRTFSMFEKMDETFNPSELDLKRMYDIFVNKVSSLLTLTEEEVQVYLILHYTRLELQELQILLINKGSKKK